MSYLGDVRWCARVIYLDLSRSGRDLGFWDLCRMCEEHGGVPLPDVAIRMKEGARCEGGEIRVSPHLSMERYLEAIPHELVHRLAWTPRWAWLNHTMDARTYDRTHFQEAVACLVGRLFVREARHREKQAAAEAARRALRDALNSRAVLEALAQEVERLSGVSLRSDEAARMVAAAFRGG